MQRHYYVDISGVGMGGGGGGVAPGAGAPTFSGGATLFLASKIIFSPYQKVFSLVLGN